VSSGFHRADSRQQPSPALSLSRLRASVSDVPTVELDEETIERLDSLRVDEESYDEIVIDLVNSYEAEELTLFHAGDEY